MDAPVAAPPGNLLEITIEPIRTLVYANLHNGDRLFHAFRIKQLEELADRPDVRVEVSLDIGTRLFPYRQRVDLSAGIVDLRNDVSLGLIWDDLSKVRDPVRTLLQAVVYVSDSPYYQQSWQITLLPIEEWIDEPDSYPWLPSYIRARDPAIEDVIVKARKYLAALADRPSAGFDAYLSATDSAPEPVDEQVQAIWSALVHDFHVSYISPSAGAEKSGQHIRTPSEIFRTGQGTCIDLATMFAACLEYTGINPVVFLYTGHANVGYWRSAKAHTEFTTGGLIASTSNRDWLIGPAGTRLEPESARRAPAVPRRMPQSTYNQLKGLIGRGWLVPIETTLLCSGAGLVEAADDATTRLTGDETVEAMIDVKTARVNRVWPIPLRGGSA